MSRLSRGFIKTKVGSWVYSKAKIPKSNPCLSVEVNRMQLQPISFLGYKQIFLARTVALEVPQHGAMPKGNIHLSEPMLSQLPHAALSANTNLCTVTRRSGSRTVICFHLYLCLATKQDLKQ